MGDNVNSVWAEHKQLKQHIIKMENAAAKTSLFTPQKGIYQPVLENAQHYIDMNMAVQVLGAERLQKYHIRNSQEEMDDLVQEHARRSEYVTKLDEKEQKKSQREKDATARLGEGHTYFSQKPQELLTARDRIEADVKADRVDMLRKPLTGGMSAEPLKNIEQYIDEKRESDQQALQNKAARAFAAQGDS